MVLPLFFPSIAIGLMFANVVVWCIRPAQKALDREAEGHNGADFSSSMKGLAKVVAITLPLALLLSFVGGIIEFR